MGVNKVVYGDETLIDISNDSVTPATLMSGVTAHNGNGDPIVGIAESMPDIVPVERGGTGNAEGLAPKATADKNGNDITITYAKIATTLAGYGITNAYTKTEVDNKVAGIVNSAPEALDTLKELAAALGNDANFSATVATNIGKKADKATTLAGYGIGDAYTKTEVDNKVSNATYNLPSANGSTLGGVKLSDSVSSSSGVSGGIAATPAAVKSAYDLAKGKQSPATTLSGYGITNAYTKDEVNTHMQALLSGMQLLEQNVNANFVTLTTDQTVSGKKTFGSVHPENGAITMATIDDDYGWLVTGYDAQGETLTGMGSYNFDGALLVKSSDNMAAYLPEGIYLTNANGACTIEASSNGALLNSSPIRTAADTYTKTEVDNLIGNVSGSGADCLKTSGGVLNGTTQISETVVGTVFEANQDNNPIVITSNKNGGITSEVLISKDEANMFCGNEATGSGNGIVCSTELAGFVHSGEFLIAASNSGNNSINMMVSGEAVVLGTKGIMEGDFIAMAGQGSAVRSHKGYLAVSVNGNACD